MMAAREAVAADMAQAVQWMTARYGQVFPADFLPTTGVAVEENGRLSAVIPIYLESSSSVAVAGHAMANPANTGKQSAAALERAMQYAIDYVRRCGKKFFVTIYGKNSVNRIADRVGFRSADHVQEKIMIVR